MIVKLAAATLAVAVALAAIVAGIHGAFARIQISERIAGPYEFVYRTAPQGDFKSVRSITTELETAFRSAGIDEVKPFDVFYPPNTEPSQIGFLVSQEDLKRILTLPNPPFHRTIVAQRFLATSIPYRSPVSFLVGFWKVDPRLREYRERRGLKHTWAATINTGDTIEYLQPYEPIQTRAEDRTPVQPTR
jgi:hypothetical protein